MKRIYLLMLILVAMAANVSAKDVPYAVFSYGGTMTYYYGEKPESEFAYDLTNSEQFSNYLKVGQSIYKAIFDESFRNAKVKTTYQWFYGFDSMTDIVNLEYLNTSEVNDMAMMFQGCASLRSLDLSSFNTSNVVQTAYMFAFCERLQKLDVSGFKTSKVEDMRGMFMYCHVDTLDLRGWDTSNVKDMSHMFYVCDWLKVIYCNDKWNCNKSENMFGGCERLEGYWYFYEIYNRYIEDISGANPNRYFTYKPVNERALSICGTTVTELNERNLTTIEGVTGTARYDNSTKTLTLTDAMIYTTADNSSAIQTNLDSLYIVVNGECMIGSLKLAGITGISHVVIKGSGKLTVVGVSAVVLLQNLGSLTVADGVQLDIQGFSQYGINGCNALKVSGKDTKLRIFGTNGCCTNLGALTLSDNLAIMDPAGAKHSNGTIVDIDGNEIKYSWVTIEYAEPYALTLNGTQVTAANNTVLNTLPGVTGTVTYDPDTKTLNLEDASIVEGTLSGGIALTTSLDTLRINVEGDCRISSSKGIGVMANSRNVVISGTGTLNITAGENGIVMYNTASNTLDIDGTVTVDVTARNYGIQGHVRNLSLSGQTTSVYTTKLNVGGEKSRLSVKGTAKCYQDLGGFTAAEGYKVTAPSNTAYISTNGDESYYTFCQATTTTVGKGKTQLITITLTPVAGTAVVIEKPVTIVPGDANGDGSVTMSDANLVVNYYLATDKSSIEGFNYDNANVNGDEDITMSDANQIVNMYLGGQ